MMCIKCDRCGEVFEWGGTEQVSGVTRLTWGEFHNRDLCKCCFEEFKIFLKRKEVIWDESEEDEA